MTVSGDELRQCLRVVPTSVVLVTATTMDGPAGLVIGSFVSVSLDPPLVGFLPGRTSTSWPRIEPTGGFCVNVLAADQRVVVDAFMGGCKFDDLSWCTSPVTGSPVIDGVVATIECDLETVSNAGDHHFVVGRVRAVERPRAYAGMVFADGAYTSATRSGAP